MSSRRDRQLQQLGIVQWVLRRPLALKGKITISLPSNVRLVMVADEPPMLTEPLVRDVLYALKISTYQVLQLTPECTAMLPSDGHCNSWLLGVEEPLTLKGSQLVSPAMKELQTNPTAKSFLWQQICTYEYDFFLSDDT